MSDVTFNISTPEIAGSEPLPEPRESEFSFNDSEPVTSENREVSVLKALDIDDDLRNLPEEDRSNLSEMSGYLEDIVKSRGLEPTVKSYAKVLHDLKLDMGLELEASPEVVLDRVGGVVKAWKSLSFVSDSKEKRAIFMKLARQPDSKSMNKLVFEEMERRRVWA